MNWQTRATNFAAKHNLNRPPGVYALDLLSEFGEVAKEILLATDYGERPFSPDEVNAANLAGELGDALYSLCLLATAAGVDLDDAFTQALAKYEARWQDSGQIGSRSDT